MTSAAITAIKERISLAALVGEYVELPKAGADLVGKCCFHQEKTASLHVHETYWRCFGACGTGGDVIDFYARIEGISKGRAIKALAERAGVMLDGKPPTRLQRTLEKRDREFERWWQKYRVREMGFRLTLMLEGGMEPDEYGERLRVIREARGAELREMASGATDYERNLWKIEKAECEDVTGWIVSAYVVAAR